MGYEPTRSRRYHGQTLRPIDDGERFCSSPPCTPHRRNRRPIRSASIPPIPNSCRRFREWGRRPPEKSCRCASRMGHPRASMICWRFAASARGGWKKCANIWSQESRQAQSKKRQQPIPPCPRSVLDVTKAAPWSKPATLPAPLKPYRKKRGGRSPNCKRRRRARVKALVA